MGFDNEFFSSKEFFYINFDFKNGCENEFKDNNEKSCSCSRNRVSHKIDFKAVWLRNGRADSGGVEEYWVFRCLTNFLLGTFPPVIFRLKMNRPNLSPLELVSQATLWFFRPGPNPQAPHKPSKNWNLCIFLCST